MGLRVALFDPEEDIELLLSDIFGVTGHELLTINKEEDIKRVVSQDIKLFILPFSHVKNWVELLREKVLIPVFIVKDESEEERLLKAGFNELNILRIPFNPLELLEKLGALDKLSVENFKELGFINTILKSFLEKRGLNLKVFSEKGECCFKTYPLILRCERDKLREILSAVYSLEDYDGDVKGNEERLSALLDYLLQEREVVWKSEEKRGEAVEDFILLFWEEEYKGVFRKNVYFLDLDGFYILVNLCPSKVLRKLVRGLKERGIGFKDVKLILLSDFDTECAEILRRIYASNPNVITVGRERLKFYLENLGLRNVKFRAVEDIPTSLIKIPTGYSIRLFPITPYPGFPSVVYLLEERNALFTGRFLGNFNGEEEELKKIFHTAYFPCEEFLKKNLSLFKELSEDIKVFPWYGKPYKLNNTVKMLSEMDYPKEYPVDGEIVLTLLNRIFMLLDDEERENFIANLRGTVEVEEGIPSNLYASPNLVYEMSIKALLNSVRDKEKFFGILKELSRYPFYIPSPEM
ncbi:hypothetical protein JCM9492_05400 [Aquifex pyrophilus]